jgi:hypothetical protein
MFRGCILVLFLAVCFAQEQRPNASAYPVGGVSIPAELKSTIRAERVHRGDPVEFRSLQAVLISKGLVMPANAKLTGRIVEAAPLQGDRPSWLVLLVERGEWKNQSVPLHAFIAAQITISEPLPASQPQQAANGVSPPINPRRAAAASATRLPQDAKSTPGPNSISTAPPLKDLRITRDANGITYLVSEHANVKLPGGTLFRLQNELPPTAPAAGDKDKPADGHPSPP